MSYLALAVFASTALAGCAAEVSAKPGAELSARVNAIKNRMHLRYAATQQLQDMIAWRPERVADDRARNRHVARGRRLARVEARVRSGARCGGPARANSDPGAAARQLADLGAKCATCHESVHARIVFDLKKPPPANPPNHSLATRMTDHRWAIARMWDGLIGPSKSAWDTGAALLVAAP